MVAMLHALDHVTLRSTDLARTLGFYQRLLGMETCPRPDFGIPGSWLHLGGRPVLHVLQRPPEGGSGVIDHVAFDARHRAVVSARLDAAAVPFRLVAMPDGSALQMFMCDPDGARIELVFRHPEDR
jgi:catechol 2,3-dioxygenase-like lactoylglutathione lyase family enzyme